jgi:hypothetical protein
MNTAKRLLGILDRLLGIKARQGVRARDAWAEALGLSDGWASQLGVPEGQADIDDEVMLALQALRAEVGSVMSLLKSAGVAERLYEGQLERIRAAAAPTSMLNEWQGMVGNVNPPDVRLALG